MKQKFQLYCNDKILTSILMSRGQSRIWILSAFELCALRRINEVNWYNLLFDFVYILHTDTHKNSTQINIKKLYKR